jgi:3-hydroxyisobutyrate dehydrogenase-like beta-hydroxyacid dehydrogenase
MTERIGLVGAGLMGQGIAANLLKHGWPLAVLEHPGNQPLEPLLQAGATACARLDALAAASDVLLLVVTGSPQVEAVVLGEGGLLAGMRSGTVVIDCSTSIPSSTERVARAVHDAGGQFLDAPMTRTPKEAAEGRLNLLVGGDPALFARCRPLLACFAENIVHAGPVGSGHRMKLLHNFVSLGSVALLCEAAACARRAGIATDVFVEVLAQGGGGGVALERVRPFLATGDPASLRFAMGNARKDLDYYGTMTREAGAADAIAQAVLGTYERGVRDGGADAMVLQLARLLERGGPPR